MLLAYLAGGRFGLEEGVCTAQHLTKAPMQTTSATPPSSTAHHCSVTHACSVCSVARFSSRFLRRTSGPSASTARHLRNTSQ